MLDVALSACLCLVASTLGPCGQHAGPLSLGRVVTDQVPLPAYMLHVATRSSLMSTLSSEGALMMSRTNLQSLPFLAESFVESALSACRCLVASTLGPSGYMMVP